LAAYTKGVESMREEVAVDSKKRGRRGSGAGVSAGVAETEVRPFNNMCLSTEYLPGQKVACKNAYNVNFAIYAFQKQHCLYR